MKVSGRGFSLAVDLERILMMITTNRLSNCVFITPLNESSKPLSEHQEKGLGKQNLDGPSFRRQATPPRGSDTAPL